MFVMKEPAIKIGSNLIISDLHLGISSEYKGIIFPVLAEILSKKISKIKKKTRTKNLIILGDIKHNIGINQRTIKYLDIFFSNIDFKKIIITKGNHDGKIENYVDAEVVDYILLGKTLLTHGHRKLPKEDFNKIIIGHNHPAIKIKDRMGMSYIVPVWCIGEIGAKKLILMPAFNDMCGKTILNESSTKLLGPVAKNMNLKESHIFLLDSTPLGKIGDTYGI